MEGNKGDPDPDISGLERKVKKGRMRISKEQGLCEKKIQ